MAVKSYKLSMKINFSKESANKVAAMIGADKVIAMECPIECSDFDWIYGIEISIEGISYIVFGVECQSKATTYRGNLIILALKKIG